MPHASDFVRALGGVVTHTTLNGSSAASRKTLSTAQPGHALAMEAANGRVFYLFGTSTVTLAAVTSADGWIMSGSKERVQIPYNATHCVWWAESDTPTIYACEVA